MWQTIIYKIEMSNKELQTQIKYIPHKNNQIKVNLLKLVIMKIQIQFIRKRRGYFADN